MKICDKKKPKKTHKPVNKKQNLMTPEFSDIA